MEQLLIYEALLVGVAIAALLCAAGVIRWERRRGHSREHAMLLSGWEGAVGYASGTVAFLLGLMLFFSVTHFTEAQGLASKEATAYATAFDATRLLSPPAAGPLQRDLACMMQTTRDGSWESMGRHDLTGDENLTAWFVRLHADLAALDPMTHGDVATATTAVMDLSQTRQARLLTAQSDLPAAIWVIIYLSVFVLFLLLGITLFGNPLLMTVALGATIILTGASIAALVFFADPYSDLGVTLEPTAIRAVIVRLQESNPGAIWDACPTLAAPMDMSSLTLTP